VPNVPPKSEEKFDLVTHVTDPVTQQTKLVNQYRLYILNGVRYFERPVGSQNLWYENNEPAGRIAGFSEKGDMKVDTAAAHKAYVAPPSGAELIASELEQTSAALEAARAELAALKAEQEQKASAQAATAAKAASKPNVQKESAL